LRIIISETTDDLGGASISAYNGRASDLRRAPRATLERERQ